MLSKVLLPLSFDAAWLAEEVVALPESDWIPHFNTGYYEGDWSGVALRSVGGRSGQIYPDPAAQDPFAPTEVLARCPRIADVLACFACEQQSVRLLRLGPGARVREHRDHALGYDDGELRVHIPVLTNDCAEFRLEGEPLKMGLGEAWYVDFNLKHSVANEGDTARVHLVVDCELNPWLDAVLRAGRAG